jgi:hypothetical protein
MSPGLRSGDLSDQAYSWRQEASYSLRLVSLGRTTFRLALAKPPSMSRGEGVYGMREEVVLDS